MSNQEKDTSNDAIWIIVAICIVGALIWFFLGKHILFVYLTLKLWQLKLITLVYPSADFLEYIRYIEENPVSKWTLKDALFVGKKVGFIINIPFIAIIGYLSYLVYDKNPASKLKRVLSMKSLKESEKRIWPYISPVVEGDILAEQFESGPFAMAMKPYDFAVKYKLLEDPKDVNSLEKLKTIKLFSSQLGKLWSGVDRLKKHEKALLAIMAAHGCGDKKGAMHAVNSIAMSVSQNIKKMPDLSSAEPLFKYFEDPKVKAVIDHHAYIYTIMAQMMEFARTTGVFPSSYFVWLKPRDRTMFYILNCVGRQVSFVEIAGIFAHWKAEQMASHKIESPMVDSARKGLELALAEVKVKV